MDVVLPRLVEVTLRCEPCGRDLGSAAPAMAVIVAAFGVGNDRWSIFTFERVSRRRHEQRLAMEARRPPVLREMSAKLRDYRRSRYPAAPDRTNSRTDVHLLGRPLRSRRGVELHCRRCSHAPRKSRRELYCRAEQALAAGRRDDYV
jgi:hypothetical protein